MKKRLSRRNFLKTGFLSSAVLVMSGCDLFAITTPQETLALLQKDLFPQANALGIATAPYLSIVFHHSRISKADKVYLKNGVKWLNEEAVTLYKRSYTQLLSTQREAVLRSFTQESWGESYLANVMNYLFEAMLGDPIYGGNNKEAGWKWLAFEGGQPRPKERYL